MPGAVYHQVPSRPCQRPTDGRGIAPFQALLTPPNAVDRTRSGAKPRRRAAQDATATDRRRKGGACGATAVGFARQGRAGATTVGRDYSRPATWAGPARAIPRNVGGSTDRK